MSYVQSFTAGGTAARVMALATLRRFMQDPANRITIVGAGVNLAATAIKAIAGYAAASPSMIADAGHSASDLLSDGVTLWAYNAARRPPTDSTPYGSGKFESIGSAACSSIIFATGAGLGWHSVTELVAHMSSSASLDAVAASNGALLGAAGAAIAGVLAKELLYRETLRIGLEARSPTMLANAWHHRTDALSSVVALAGVAGTAAGLPMIDALGGLVVSSMVMRVGVEMGIEAISDLTDSQADDETLDRVTKLIKQDADAIDLSQLRVRRLGPYSFVELRLQVPYWLSISAAQQVATKAKLRVLEGMPEVAECSIELDAERPSLTARSVHGQLVVGDTVLDADSVRSGEATRSRMLMRATGELDADVRAAIALGGPTFSGLWGVTHTNAHWSTRRGGAVVEMSLVIDPALTVREAHRLAREAKQLVLARVPDVLDADLHLELFEHGCMAATATPASLPLEHRLPSVEEAERRLSVHVMTMRTPMMAMGMKMPSPSSLRQRTDDRHTPLNPQLR